MPKFFSLTYEIFDEAKFQAKLSQFMAEFAVDDEKTIQEAGFAVTAAGWCDTASEADYMRREIEEDGKDPLDVVRYYLQEENPELAEEQAEERAKAILGY